MTDQDDTPDPDTIRRRIKALGITQNDFARICHVNPATVRKWLMAPGDAKTARGISPTALAVLGWLETGFRPPEWPRGK